MVDLACRPPCVNNVAEPIPGVVPPVFNPGASDATDADLVTVSGTTDAAAGKWSQLMAADAGRRGASILNKHATDSLFVLVYDTGLPADGTQVGEFEVLPGKFTFDYRPMRRYVIRGEAVSMAYDLQTW